MKTFNIDELLDNQAIKIKIKDKEYVVRDFPSDLYDKCRTDGALDTKKLVAGLLGTTEEEVATFGTVAITRIMDLVTSNLLEAPGSIQPTQEG